MEEEFGDDGDDGDDGGGGGGYAEDVGYAEEGDLDMQEDYDDEGDEEEEEIQCAAYV
jgi:hypothetical protein